MALPDHSLHQRNLQTTLNEVVDIFNKQELVSDLVKRQAARRQDLVQGLLLRQQRVELRRKLIALHPADIAYVLENLPLDQRYLLWSLVKDAERGAVLLELSDVVCENLINSMTQSEIIEAASHLDPSRVSGLLSSLPDETIIEVLNALDSRNRERVRSALAFPKGSVGAMMDMDIYTINEIFSVEMALNSLRASNIPEKISDPLYVTDKHGEFKGMISLRDLILNDPLVKIADIMRTDIMTFYTDNDVRDAVSAFERYDLITAPVVNLHNHLVGKLSIDRIVDLVDELNQKERLNKVGLSEEEDLYAPIWNSARNRWFWLGLNLTTAFIASRVIGLFEDTIVQLVALATLMPIVASIGGNTGNQTVALVIREMTLKKISVSDLMRFLFKEIGISLINGLIWGIVVAGFAYIIYLKFNLSLVMLFAMLANLLIAAVAGVLIPVILQKLGRDPVMGSSVMLTAITDSMGFFVLLGTASVFLL